ncbi:sulfatase [Paenibacillus curdlanolyticus YK9]|uniref:Sulfatase n=1 Tax=Paenibacillus curdlanolyticus YK9 TaxID=717606 RepID=E0IAL9_9BACL|nr:LTA synthase family protein [Paenibacillus curdlanolyticus]EFM10423.1 sulfatase [Paenibacillus curdlanolyticus YK9]
MSHNRRTWLYSPFFIFSIVMIIKVYMSWQVIYDIGFSWKPLLTELPAIWAIFAIIELLASKRKLGIYLAVNLLLTGVYFAVIMYYKYFGIIVTYHALAQVGQVGEVKGSVFQLMHPSFLLIFTDIVAIGLALTFSKKARGWASVSAARFPRSAMASLLVVMLAVALVTVWQHKDVINEVRQTEEMGIVNYELYKVATSGKDDRTVAISEVTPEAIMKLKGNTPVPAGDKPADWAAAQGRNVIVIQMEAFQNFLLGLKVNGHEVTPNLNKLKDESVYFKHMFQMVGQGNTSDAEFMTNTSLYVPPIGAATDEYVDHAIPSLPKRFEKAGYLAATFHTNDVKFWNRDKLYSALGFNYYYDKEWYGTEDTIAFGSSDKILYEQAIKEIADINKSGQRVYANIISMSSHHPFNFLPDSVEKLQLPEQYEGSFAGNYIQSQHYADEAIGLLIDKLKEYGLWDNTMLVIYGDHMGLPVYSLNDTDRELLQSILGKPYSYTDMLNIPLIIAAPGALEPEVRMQTAGQVDIMPTIANLAGIPLDNEIYFGQDLMNHTSNLLPERYYLPSGSLINDKSIFVPGEQFKDGVVYPLPGDPAEAPYPAQSEFDRALKLLELSHTYAKSLPPAEGHVPSGAARTSNQTQNEGD